MTRTFQKYQQIKTYWHQKRTRTILSQILFKTSIRTLKRYNYYNYSSMWNLAIDQQQSKVHHTRGGLQYLWYLHSSPAGFTPSLQILVIVENPAHIYFYKYTIHVSENETILWMTWAKVPSQQLNKKVAWIITQLESINAVASDRHKCHWNTLSQYTGVLVAEFVTSRSRPTDYIRLS